MTTESETEVFTEKRRGWTVIFTQIADVLIGRQSRKVAFGVWLFFVATTLLKATLITSDQWLTCVYLSVALVGFGTIVDGILEKVGEKITAGVANHINTFTAVISAPKPGDPPTS
jgi:hypothetical protein